MYELPFFLSAGSVPRPGPAVLNYFKEKLDECLEEGCGWYPCAARMAPRGRE